MPPLSAPSRVLIVPAATAAALCGRGSRDWRSEAPRAKVKRECRREFQAEPGWNAGTPGIENQNCGAGATGAAAAGGGATKQKGREAAVAAAEAGACPKTNGKGAEAGGAALAAAGAAKEKGRGAKAAAGSSTGGSEEGRKASSSSATTAPRPAIAVKSATSAPAPTSRVMCAAVAGRGGSAPTSARMRARLPLTCHLQGNALPCWIFQVGFLTCLPLQT